MSTLHLAPTGSASGSLRQALRDAKRPEEVLAFQDDLSCGPIEFNRARHSRSLVRAVRLQSVRNRSDLDEALGSISVSR